MTSERTEEKRERISRPTRFASRWLQIAAIALLLTACAASEPEPQSAQYEGLEWSSSENGLELRKLDERPVYAISLVEQSMLVAPKMVDATTSLYRSRAIGGLVDVPCTVVADCVPPPPCPDRVCPPEGLTLLDADSTQHPDVDHVAWALSDGVASVTCGQTGVYCIVASLQDGEVGGVALAAGEAVEVDLPVSLFLAEPLMALDPANVPCFDVADCVPPGPCNPNGVCPPEMTGAFERALGWIQ